MRAGCRRFGCARRSVAGRVALDTARAAPPGGGKDVETAARELAEHGERLQAAAREAAARMERHATLAETVGAAVAELRAPARRCRERAARERARQRHDRRAAREAQREEGRGGRRRQQLAVQLEQATERRRADVDALRRFASTGLIAVALGEVELPEASRSGA